MDPHINPRAHSADLYITNVLLLLVTQLVNMEVTAESQAFPAISPRS